MNYLTLFRALAPEVMLLLAAFVALTFDLLLQHSHELQQRMRIAGVFAIVGLLGAIVLLVQQIVFKNIKHAALQ